MKKTRESNIELLRITLMLMIISHHVIVHGLGLKNIILPENKISNSVYIEFLLNSFLVIGVNVFVFISGYFGIKFNLKRIISIVIQAISYSVIFYLALCLINKADFNIVSFIKSFFPISLNIWWFITTYFGLYILAPFLNAGMKNIPKPEFSYILIGIFILNCFSSFIFGGISKNGYDLFNFIFLYLLGRIFKQNDMTIKYAGATLLLCTGTVAVLGSIFVYLNKYSLAWHLFYYNNPVLILSAVSLFFIFQNLKVGNNRYINNTAQLILGVYMIHDYPYIRNWLIGIVDFLRTNYNMALLPFLLVALILSIFIISSLIEYSRLSLYNSISNRVNETLRINEYKSKLLTFANKRYKIF